MDIAVSILSLIELEEYRGDCHAKWREDGEEIALPDPRHLVDGVPERLECQPDVHTDGRQPEEDRESGELEEKPNEDANFRSEEVPAATDDNHQKGDQYGEVQGELQLCDVVVPELLNQEVQQDDH